MYIFTELNILIPSIVNWQLIKQKESNCSLWVFIEHEFEFIKKFEQWNGFKTLKFTVSTIKYIFF